MTTLSHKIQLHPTASQVRSLSRAVGCARFAWNWGLAEWKRQYAASKNDPSFLKPTIASVKSRWGQVKHVEFPWLAESPANANLQPFTNLDRAYKNFFQKRSRFPRFKKKGRHDSFYVDNQKMKLDKKTVRLPKIGKVKLTEALRFDGKVLKGTVSREADRWFLSVSVELRESQRQRTGDEVVGVDLGIEKLATLSTGEVVANLRPLQRRLKRLKRLQQVHARKVKGSENRRKSAQHIAKTHWKVKNTRNDGLHKLTTRLCRENQAVVIEDLNVRGMLKNRKLSRAISDVGWGEFRRQLTYKAPLYGTQLVVADRFFPSSKTCSACGCVNSNLVLSDRTFCCPTCDFTIDRDVNAAINLYTLGMREIQACGERVRPGDACHPAVLVEAGSTETSS